jgi:peptidyl-prolyl cis-trans isomerase C
MQKPARFSAIALLAGALGLSLPAHAQTDAAQVLARVGDVSITLGHAISMRGQLPAQFASVPDETLFPAIVEQLIDQELLRQFGAPALGLSAQIQLENDVRAFVATDALNAAAAAAITPQTLAMAYEAFAAEFAQGEPMTEYNAAHILVRTEEEILAVVAALSEGRDFAELASEVSLDGSAAQGGDLGWFGPGVMIAPFEAAVMALSPGEVSDPVETRFGWHLVRLIDSRIAAVPPLEAVRADLEQQLQREAARALIQRLRADTAVETLTEGVDPSLLGRADLLDE